MPKYAQVWDLDSLLPAPTTDAFKEIVADYRAGLETLANQVEGLAPPGTKSAADWSKFLVEYERLESLAGDLGSHIGCWAAGDAGNKTYRQFEATLSSLDPLREKIRTQCEFALKQTSDAELASFLAADVKLQSSAFFFRQLKKNAAMRLPLEQELLAADLAVDGQHAWGRLYDRVSGELRITVMERGELVQKSPSQIRYDTPERSVRQNNFYAAEKAWKTVADTCADALNHLAGSRLTQYRRLGLKDHLDMPLHRNRMRRETLAAMWQAVSDRKHVLLDYLGSKARRLGIERLAWYDVHAPLPMQNSNSQRIDFDEGADLVIASFNRFSPDLGDFARHALENRWCERENRPGKRQGAFCTGFPTKGETRVFQTFTDTHDDVSTLAHELGHAYHSWVLRKEPLFLQDYPMNLAETASTFAEAVLAEGRLQTADAPVRISILDHMLSDSVAYLMNIHARFVFEDRFHQERASGELASDRISALMLEAQQQTYQNGLAADGWYPDFWVSKLHFYISGLPFYNFPYTFGYLLSTGLFALGQAEPKGFAERYRKFLIATGCQETEEALMSTFGFDLSKPDFWNRSLDVVARRVEQFVALP